MTVVVVRGEAGIGKTLLIDKFLEEATKRGAQIIAGRADLLERGIPYAPIHHALARIVPHASESISPLVERAIDAMSASSERKLERRTELALDACWRLIHRLAADQTTVLAIDDLHAADEDTIALLAALTRRLAGLPVLILISARSDDLIALGDINRFLAPIASESRTSIIELGPLSKEHVGRILEEIAGGPVAATVVDGVYDRSGGNAFFVAELCAAMSDRGGLQLDTDRRLALREDRVWPTRSLAVIQRILPLGGPVLTLARVLSASGDLRLSHLPAIAQVAKLSDIEAETAFDSLVRAHLLVRRPDGSFGFRHEILREALYEDLSPTARRRIHIDLATQLLDARQRGHSVDITIVATHAVAATDGPDETAAALAQECGDAVCDFAPLSAANWYHTAVRLTPPRCELRFIRLARNARALMCAQIVPEAIARAREALKGLTDPSERARCLSIVTAALLRSGNVDAEAEALALLDSEISRVGSVPPRLLIDRSSTLTALSRFDEAAADVELARSLASVDSTDYLLALTNAVRLAETRGHLADVDNMLKELLRVAPRLSRHTQILSYSLAAQVLAHESRIELAQPQLERARKLIRDGDDDAVDERLEMAETLIDFYRGEWDEAIVRAVDQSEHSVGTGVSACLPYLEFVETTIRASRGDLAGARQIAARSGSPSSPALRAIRSGTRGWLELFTGRPREACEELTAGLSDTADTMNRALLLALLARAHHALGNTNAAKSHLNTCVDLEANYPVPRVRIETRLAIAEVSRDPAAAREAFEIASATNMPFFAARAQLLRGELDDEPADVLADAWHRFRVLRADVWRRRSGAALRVRGFPVPRAPRRQPDKLNEVEKDIVNLVREGLSNGQIAERLSYSKHTINAYLTRIYARTGYSSRYDLLRGEPANTGS